MSATTCYSCGASAPPANGEVTLVSMSGWRLQLESTAEGGTRQVWRCPVCWAVHKAKRREPSAKT